MESNLLSSHFPKRKLQNPRRGFSSFQSTTLIDMFYFLISFILPFLWVSFSFLLPFLSAFPSFFLSLGFLLLLLPFLFAFPLFFLFDFSFFPLIFSIPPLSLSLCLFFFLFFFLGNIGIPRVPWVDMIWWNHLFFPRDILGTIHHHGKKLNGLWGTMLRPPGPLGNRRSEAAAADAFAFLPSRLSAATRGHAVRHQCIGSVLVGPWRTHVCRTHVWTWLLAIKHRNGHFRF